VPFQLNFTTADHFDADDAILFLKPDTSEELVDLHHRAVGMAESVGLTSRHQGEEWVPHCTCDYGISHKQLSAGLSILRRFLPVHARIEAIGYVEVTPQSVREFGTRVV
jgi:2'-5' RNA ligase